MDNNRSLVKRVTFTVSAEVDEGTWAAGALEDEEDDVTGVGASPRSLILLLRPPDM